MKAVKNHLIVPIGLPVMINTFTGLKNKDYITNFVIPFSAVPTIPRRTIMDLRSKFSFMPFDMITSTIDYVDGQERQTTYVLFLHCVAN